MDEQQHISTFIFLRSVACGSIPESAEKLDGEQEIVLDSDGECLGCLDACIINSHLLVSFID